MKNLFQINSLFSSNCSWKTLKIRRILIVLIVKATHVYIVPPTEVTRRQLCCCCRMESTQIFEITWVRLKWLCFITFEVNWLNFLIFSCFHRQNGFRFGKRSTNDSNFKCKIGSKNSKNRQSFRRSTFATIPISWLATDLGVYCRFGWQNNIYQSNSFVHSIYLNLL